MSNNVTVVDHPLVLHKLTLMRDKHCPSAVFRQLLREISLLLAYEVLRDLPMTTQTIETPLMGNGSADPQRQEALPGIDPACRQWPT